jgi:NAD(P)-dependent dehydrogenase (short-subunit alcohol dehydrogenase family)
MRPGSVAAAIGGRAFAVDVTNPAADEVLARAIDAAGPIRGLVSCGGIGKAARIVGRVEPMPLDAFEAVVRVNRVGTFNMLRLEAAHMTGQELMAGSERGVIVNTASVAAFDGQVGRPPMPPRRAGSWRSRLPAAGELARFGIRVNTVAPGIFLTPLLSELPGEVRYGITAAIPFPHRLGAPEEFAAAVRFCLENAYLNAEVIRLDGGVRLPPR